MDKLASGTQHLQQGLRVCSPKPVAFQISDRLKVGKLGKSKSLVQKSSLKDSWFRGIKLMAKAP